MNVIDKITTVNLIDRITTTNVVDRVVSKSRAKVRSLRRDIHRRRLMSELGGVYYAQRAADDSAPPPIELDGLVAELDALET